MRKFKLITMMTVLCGASACDAESVGRPFDHSPDNEYWEEAPPPTSMVSVGTIHPVVFVPDGSTFSASDRNGVEAGLSDIKAWYRDVLAHEGVDLRWAADLTIVDGDHDAAWYLTADNMGTAFYEVEQAFGLSGQTPGHISLIMGVDFLGWAGGSGNGQSGHALVGLDSLIAPANCSGEWWCNGDMWRGTVIHELGHALSLPHSEEPSIMSFHGDYMDKTLIETASYPELSTVRALPFTRAAHLIRWSWAECDTDPCDVWQTHDTDSGWSHMGTVPRGTRMGVFVEDGNTLVVSYPMTDRSRQVQVVSRSQFKSAAGAHRPPPVADLRAADRYCAAPTCEVMYKRNLDSGSTQTLGTVPCGTRMGVFVTSDDWDVVSYPMSDRARTVQIVPVSGSTWSSTAPGC